MSQRAAFSERDQRALAGVGFLATVVLAYFLLVDGPLTKLGKLGPELGKTRETLAMLQSASRIGGKTSRSTLPPLFAIGPGESASMRVQQDLASRFAAPGVTPLSLTVGDQPVEHGGLLVYLAKAKIEGPYEAIAGIIAAWQQPAEAVSLDGVAVTLEREHPDRLIVDLDLSYFTAKSPGRPGTDRQFR